MSHRKRLYSNLPPLNALRAFEAAARHLNFSRAAEELCVTQGAVSRQIGKLENFLGVTLFIRHHGATTLNTTGAAYLRDVRAALGTIDSATEQVMAAGPQGLLKIKCPPTLAMRWLIPRLSLFSALHPGITVHVTTTEEPVDFDSEDIDIGLSYGESTGAGMISALLFHEELIPICHPECVNQRPPPKSLHELPQYVMLHSLFRPHLWRRWLDAAGASHIPVKEGLRFENSGLLCVAASKGLGIAIVSMVFAADELAGGRLIAPFSRSIINDIGYYLLTSAEKLETAPVSTFWNWIQSEMQSSLAAA